MKKKFLLFIVMCVMALVLPLVLMEAKAATILGSTHVDEFLSGIDDEEYNIIGDTDDSYSLYERAGQLKISNFDYANGYVRTKNPVEIPTGNSLVVQWEVVSNILASGYVAYFKGASDYNNGWGDSVMHNAAGAILFDAKNILPFNPAGTPTMWQDTAVLKENALARQVYNADGSAEYYGVAGNDAAGLVKLAYWTAGAFTNTGSGYFGFGGNTMVGDFIIDNFKIGYASDSTCSDITWLLEDNFDTADNWTIEVGADRTQLGAAKYLAADDPVDGAAIVYNNEFALLEGQTRLFDASLELDITSITAGKAIGIVAGLDADATSIDGAPFVGVRATADAAELVLIDAGQVVKTVVLDGALLGKATLDVTTKVNDEGAVVLTCSLGSKSISHEFDSLDGKIGIATVGEEGTLTAKILKLSVNSFNVVYEGGRTLSTDFSEPLNKNWEIVSMPTQDTDGFVGIVDDKLEFEMAGDGSMFGTKYKYVNFELEFDIVVQQFYEDDDGNIIPDSTWPGISFGKPELGTPFASANLIYFQKGTCDLLNFANNARVWLAPANDMTHIDNENVPFKVRVHALDGTVSIYVTNSSAEDPAEFLVGTYTNVNTRGYVCIACTAGGNFTIDNFSIKNLDGNEIVNAKPVITTAKTTLDTSVGVDLTGSVTATDADNDLVTYELVADNTTEHGTLTFNKFGSFTFTPTKAGTVSFTYKATDTEDYSEVGTITINVNSAPVLPSTAEEMVVAAGETKYGRLVATDAQNDDLTYELVADNTTEAGTLTLNSDGAYKFVAKDDAAVGSVTFTYKVFDGKVYSEVETVTININGAPVITTETTTYTVEVGGTITGRVTATDADTVTFALVVDNLRDYGTLTFNADGTFTFVAKADAGVGSATFTYSATDGILNSETARITISVRSAEDKGCKGSIAASIISIMALTGVVFILRKKKENE